MQKINFSNYFLSEADNSTHVMTFMRANPITIGHERVVNQVQQLAKDFDAGHSVILSHSHDGDKNPLTPEQKLRHARIAFPGVNVSTSSPESPSLLHHVAKLSQKGVRNLHLVVGQDRVDQFNTLLNKYNHVDAPHGRIDLDNITVHSAGGRDPDAEGVEGISGSLQRHHAINNDFDSYRAGAPSRYNDQQVMDQMNDVRNGIVPKAPKKVAVAKAVTKLKKLKEESGAATVADGGYIGGLGYISGNPAVDINPLQQYIDTNALAKDDENANLMKMIKNSKNNILGFKSFDPKELENSKRGKK